MKLYSILFILASAFVGKAMAEVQCTPAEDFYVCYTQVFYKIYECDDHSIVFCDQTKGDSLETCKRDRDSAATKICRGEYDHAQQQIAKVMSQPKVKMDCSFEKPLQLVSAADFSLRTKNKTDKVCVTMSFCTHNAEAGEPVGLVPLEYNRAMACMPVDGVCSKTYDQCDEDDGLLFTDRSLGPRQIQKFVHPKTTVK